MHDYGSLVDELLAMDELQSTDIVVFPHIAGLYWEAQSSGKAVPDCIRIEDEQLIPKKIHYCWFGGNPIPDELKRYMESWHKFCPDYEIIEWNESNYDISKNKYMHDAYQKKIWGFVPDYARIDVVYRHGGIYLDTDVELVRNIDDLLYQKGFAGFDDAMYVNFGIGFGAVKGLPILKRHLEYYEELEFIKADGSLNLLGSPAYQTEVFLKHGLVLNGEYQKVEDMTIYPERVLAGKCLRSMRTVIKPWTYAIHHYAGTWGTERDRNANARMTQDMKMYHADAE